MILVKDFMVICSRSISKVENENIIITYLTDKEEKALDNTGIVVLERGEHKFVVDKTSKPIYGPIDFHRGSDDYAVIETMDWLNHITGQGIIVPSDYNYDEHCCYSLIKRVRSYDTTNPAIVAQYMHGCLGKPEKTIIFKRKVKNGVKRN